MFTLPYSFFERTKKKIVMDKIDEKLNRMRREEEKRRVRETGAKTSTIAAALKDIVSADVVTTKKTKGKRGRAPTVVESVKNVAEVDEVVPVPEDVQIEAPAAKRFKPAAKDVNANNKSIDLMRLAKPMSSEDFYDSYLEAATADSEQKLYLSTRNEIDPILARAWDREVAHKREAMKIKAEKLAAKQPAKQSEEAHETDTESAAAAEGTTKREQKFFHDTENLGYYSTENLCACKTLVLYDSYSQDALSSNMPFSTLRQLLMSHGAMLVPIRGNDRTDGTGAKFVSRSIVTRYINCRAGSGTGAAGQPEDVVVLCSANSKVSLLVDAVLGANVSVAYVDRESLVKLLSDKVHFSLSM